jgi:hypothetical protein
MVVRRANECCEVCGANRNIEQRRWIEAHERWEYDDVQHIQSLRRLIALCSQCHRVTHFGRQSLSLLALAYLDAPAEARKHLRAVTGMNTAAAEQHIAEAFAVWRERSKSDWTIDLSILDNIDVTVIK